MLKMLTTGLTIVSLLSGTMTAFAAPQLADDHQCARAKRAAMRRAASLGTLDNLPDEPTDFSTDTDVLHYILDIEIDPDNQWLGGSNTMQVNVLTDNVSLFQVQISDTFDIPSITANGTEVFWTRLDYMTIEIILDRTYNTGEQFDLVVTYSGYPVSQGRWGSIEYKQHNGTWIVQTLSEPWFANSWWPSKDDNYDKATADQYYTVPNWMIVASNGVLESVDDVGGDRLRYHWHTDYQMVVYLYSFATTNYETFSDTFNYDGYSMPCEFFLYPESNNSSNRNAMLRSVDMLATFSDLYGLYPFINEKYGIYQFGWGGGMEHQTMTGQGSFGESLTAHELAHQWWGDMITCATWHDIWLNEGFATYSEAIWYEFRYGQNPQAYLNAIYNRKPTQFSDSVYVYDTSSETRIFSSNYSYRMGAWVLHMLRHILGDDLFFDGLATYRNAYEYDSATTDDFQAVLEGVCGRDLDWFFDTQVYSAGAPEYRTTWQQFEINDQNYVELYIHQTQNGEYPIFPMPIDIVTVTGNDRVIHPIWNDAELEHFLFTTDGPIDDLEFDPEQWGLWEIAEPVMFFIDGPPKIIAITPYPDTEMNRPVTNIRIGFHEPIIATENDFTLVGDTTGPIDFNYAYIAQQATVVLTFDTLLPNDIYTLTISDLITDQKSGYALDGEINPESWVEQPTLPSGDGEPGGNAVVRFTVNSGFGAVEPI